MYLRLLMFLLPILTPACYSSIPAFLIMCSVYRLNKQGDRRQPCHTPFSILNQSVVPYRILTVASWPAYRFLRKQVRWSSIPITRTAFHSLLWSTQSIISSVQSLSCVRLFETPWTAARQASLSITNSRGLLRLMSIDSMRPSSRLILCCPHLLLPSVFPNIRVLSSESSLCISSVQLLSHIRLFVTSWTAARQASLSITNSQNLLKLMSIESVMSYSRQSFV